MMLRASLKIHTPFLLGIRDKYYIAVPCVQIRRKTSTVDLGQFFPSLLHFGYRHRKEFADPLTAWNLS